MSVSGFIINRLKEKIKEGKGKTYFKTSDLQTFAVEYTIKHKKLHLASYFEREFRKIKASDLFEIKKDNNKSEKQNHYIIRRKKCK